MENVAVPVIDFLRDDIKSVFINEGQKNAAGCSMYLVLSDDQVLIVSIVYIITSFPVQFIKMLFCISYPFTSTSKTYEWATIYPVNEISGSGLPGYQLMPQTWTVVNTPAAE